MMRLRIALSLANAEIKHMKTAEARRPQRIKQRFSLSAVSAVNRISETTSPASIYCIQPGRSGTLTATPTVNHAYRG
jgi:hypothetical protein